MSQGIDRDMRFAAALAFVAALSRTRTALARRLLCRVVKDDGAELPLKGWRHAGDRT